MTAAQIVALVTAITGLVGAVGAILHSLQTRKIVNRKT